ncbi:ion channel CASTOR-like [Cynara cardunculus var. scolymus]|uniref:ion channel CASTOR-like n=1 Tax=Cynara cardunculus var. scolymus TaxID=59895 RepID=UPI000D626C72|nr:ion channel CASTOR-like [Cynara cardunculus var. scolymus]
MGDSGLSKKQMVAWADLVKCHEWHVPPYCFSVEERRGKPSPMDSHESSPPSVSRDWFFPSPSPSFIHSSSDHLHKTPTRRFSTYPRPSSSSPASSSHRDVKYAGFSRRTNFSRRYQRSPAPEVAVSSLAQQIPQKLHVSDDKTSIRNTFIDLAGGRLKFRWHMAFLVALLITTFSSLLHKNISLHNQANDLQAQIIKLNGRLQVCNLLEPMDFDDFNSQETINLPNKSLKTIALVVSVTLLSIPFVFLKYVEYISKSKSPDNLKEEASLNKQLAYKVDVFLSVRPYSKPLALLVATLLLIGVGGLALFGVTDDSLADCLWLSWSFVADSGNHANSEGVGPRLVSVSISFGGMLIFAMMLGLVTDAISEKFDSLRKGRSEVVKKDHTLILGWSDKLGSLLNQLAIANESLGGGIVVVMAERDKEEMELDIAKMEFDFRQTSVICRSGSPLILADLKKVSVSKARAIIVLAEDGNADQSDARALRTVLSLTGVKDGLRGHIVVELGDLDNEVLVKLVGGDLVETVVAHDVIGRLMIQCARQPGLAQVWEDILGFENCEFYIKRWPQLDGMHFEDVLISFPDAIPCGVKSVSCGGKIILNPDDSYVLQEGDEVLVIAEDDDTYAPVALPTVWRGNLPKEFIGPNSMEKILLCGWRRDIEDMITVLDAFLAPGSELWMFNEVVEGVREHKLIDGGLDIERLMNITLVHREGNAVIRRHLESLPLESFDSILILADESVEDSAIQADSRSLATLLLIRDIQAKRLPYREAKATQGRKGSFSQGSWIGEMQQASDKSVIISEILDPRTKNLLSMSRISDYVLSNELVSMALAMVAEDRQINDVLEELFAEEGNEMHIRQADLYLKEGEELSFYEILLRARQRREIVIGYRIGNVQKAIINPPGKLEKRRWSVKDVFVVIAEKE